MRAFGATLLILGLAAGTASLATAGPLTFNTALPVSQGEGILRGDAFVLRGSSGFMDEDVTGLAFPFVLGYGLTRDLTLFAVAPVFIHKSVNATTPMGRISRGSNGFGDMLFLGRYMLLEVDHPGSTFRIAPFAGFQAPTGAYHTSDRYSASPAAARFGRVGAAVRLNPDLPDAELGVRRGRRLSIQHVRARLRLRQ